MRRFDIFVVCLLILTIVDCQTLVYYCNFDVGLIDDCAFDESITGVSTLTTVSGVIPTHLKPTEPLSDVTSIRLLTTPNNESCLLPYDYRIGDWSMYFCEWNSSTNFTCPTASGIRNCIIGEYAHFKTNIGDFDETHLTNVSTRSSTEHCLDFFYYLTDVLDEAKISVGWKSNEIITTIVEVTAQSENRWQQNRTTYTSPSSEMNQIWFKMTRNSTSSRVFTYALDEIKIFEGACESIPSAIISFSNTIDSDTSEIPIRLTTDMTHTISKTVLDATISTDEMKLTTDDDVQTATIFSTTEEEMNMTISNTTDLFFTTETSQTRSTTIQTTITSDVATVSSTKKTDLIATLGVPLGLGIPALFIIIGGLFYHYRHGQLVTKALAGRTNANEIPMTTRSA